MNIEQLELINALSQLGKCCYTNDTLREIALPYLLDCIAQLSTDLIEQAS